MTAQVRCAVYTRKSSEEGLDQAFNSLDAQRQAGLDYIKSQRHEGWSAIPDTYDDGGHSGGTIERPALRRLLADIAAGRVDIVVVYKVDRLSRSLADFARLMQLFEDRGVSFVSVTQQFSTTTSMGRLTLNMLLSFAQFEREVAGERIRDKIAATRRRGVWVCGRPPTGYRLPPQGDPDRSLRVHDEEAGLIRRVFERYIELGSPLAVAQELNSAGFTTPLWTSARGIRRGGKPFTAKDIHRLLTNPVYIGKIAHTRDGMTELYDALHQPIVEQSVWEKAHAKISKAERDQQRRWTHTHLLKGKLRTAEGHTMSPGSVQPAPQGRPHRGQAHRPVLHQPAGDQARLCGVSNQEHQRGAPRRLDARCCHRSSPSRARNRHPAPAARGTRSPRPGCGPSCHARDRPRRFRTRSAVRPGSGSARQGFGYSPRGAERA